MEFPLDADVAKIAAMRKLRNSLGHALHFDSNETEKRRELDQGPLDSETRALYSSIEVPVFEGE